MKLTVYLIIQMLFSTNILKTVFNMGGILVY